MIWLNWKPADFFFATQSWHRYFLELRVIHHAPPLFISYKVSRLTTHHGDEVRIPGRSWLDSKSFNLGWQWSTTNLWIMLGSLASANGKCGYSGLSESHLPEKWGSFSLGVDFVDCVHCCSYILAVTCGIVCRYTVDIIILYWYEALSIYVYQRRLEARGPSY